MDRLTYIGRHGIRGKKGKCRSKSIGLYVCDCSPDEQTIFTTLEGSVRYGSTKSCGCLRLEALAKAITTHGHAGEGRRSLTYVSWDSMIQRCTNPNHIGWKNYGGRKPDPVGVCKRWRESFIAFREDMGERPGLEYCISRHGDTGNYEPGNASWKLKTENTSEMHLNHPTGPNRKLTDSDADLIRALRGQVLQKVIAEGFGVAPQTVAKIQLGETYTQRVSPGG